MISNICEACDVSGRVVVIVGFLSLIESGLKQKCRLEFARATTTLILKVKFTNKLFNYINQKFVLFGGGEKLFGRWNQYDIYRDRGGRYCRGLSKFGAGRFIRCGTEKRPVLQFVKPGV